MITARLGYVSPLGEFFPCGCFCHESLAASICERFCGSTLDPQGHLRRSGWTLVDADGSMDMAIGTNPTDAQIKTLTDLCAAWEALDPALIFVAIMDNHEGYAPCEPFYESVFNGDAFLKSLRDSLELLDGTYADRIRAQFDAEGSLDNPMQYTIGGPVITPVTKRLRRPDEPKEGD